VANGVKDMDEELKEIIVELTKRLEFLERHDRQAEATAVMEGQNTVDQRAQFLALYSIVQELADREGFRRVFRTLSEARPSLSRLPSPNSREYKSELVWPN
jgi:hypothetical protein